MSPYHPTFIMLDGRVMYRDRCQWGNSELELTAHQKLNSFYICVHGQDSLHGHNSGMYKDSQAWEEGDAPARACKRRRQEREWAWMHSLAFFGFAIGAGWDLGEEGLAVRGGDGSTKHEVVEGGLPP